MADSLRVFYLHGFASGPTSSKAKFFRQQLTGSGVDFSAPDLAEGNFEALTITAQLAVIQRLIGLEPAVLIGSSLGGYLAALTAAVNPLVKRLLLLAPAFDFLPRWKERLGPEQMEQWRITDELSVFHYGEGRNRTLSYRLMTDAEQYPLIPDFAQPALLFHGTQDEVVPVDSSRRFVYTHPNARLVALSSDHQLTDVLDSIWQDGGAFLLGQTSQSQC